MQNKKWWEFKNYSLDQPIEELEEIELKIGGEIVNVPCWEGDVSSNAFKAELNKYPKVKNIKLKINSPGGDVFEAVDIFNELKQHPAKVEVIITGMCASAATLIAMSADKGLRKMCFNGMFMIHNGMSHVQGNAKAMRERADLLDSIDGSVIINTYKQQSKLSEEEIQVMLDKTSWLTASQALELGFIDEILDYNVEPEEAIAVQNFVRGQVVTNFKNLPVGMIKNMLTPLKNLEPKVKNKIESEAKTMDLKEFQEKHPDVYNQAVAQATQSVQNTERERIKNIMNLGKKVTGADEIIQNAIDSGKTAEQVAFEIMNNSSIQTTIKAKETFEKLKTDTEGAKVPEVETETPGEKDPQEVSVVNAAVEAFKNTK